MNGRSLKIKSFLIVASISASSLSFGATVYKFGTYERPFQANSLWNSKPVDPVLGTVSIPPLAWYPQVAEGAYSSSTYNAKITDPAVAVFARDPDTDGNVVRRVVIPHFPSGVTPATGGDGHADIVDESRGIIHSFYQMKHINGVWTASTYNFTYLKGTGFGTPAHNQAGARAAGVVTMAGMIRKHEVNDGLDMYNHALTLSLDKSAFLKDNGAQRFIFPATAEDGNGLASYAKVDGYAMGSLLMLPKDFDLTKIKRETLRKVAKTLMNYGAYVTDQNYMTPFAIYVENGSNYKYNPGGAAGWDGIAAADLRLIEKGLRKVVSNSGFVDGNGNPFVPNQKQNILSMRGGWVIKGTSIRTSTIGADYNTLTQSMLFPKPANGKAIQAVQYWKNNMLPAKYCSYACKKPGALYRFKVLTVNGGTLQMVIRNTANQVIFTSKVLANGEYQIFTMPVGSDAVNLYASSGITAISLVRGELTEE